MDRRPADTALWLLFVGVMVSGCRNSPQPVPSVLVLDRKDYDRAFDAAIESARAAGMVTAVRDRQGGLIETEPRSAGTLLEPWRLDNSGVGQAAENTLAPHRRRARFEFISTDFIPPEPSPGGALRGPDLDSVLGRAAAPLTEAGGPVELRVWVYLEQSFNPNMRHFLWTRQLTTQAFEVATPPDPRESVEPETLWTPVGRDEDYERRLMSAVVERLGGEELTRSSDRPGDRPHQPPD
jgi:hypothetical protein